jgi:redox-sensitive bicupin YhaK (pirin superfamily)
VVTDRLGHAHSSVPPQATVIPSCVRFDRPAPPHCLDSATRVVTRFRTRAVWLDNHHSFSFGNHYDPHNRATVFLRVSNDDRVHPDTGLGTLPHRDLEIVAWVLVGQLRRRDSEGNHGLCPGARAANECCTGIEHSGENASSTEDVPRR